MGSLVHQSETKIKQLYQQMEGIKDEMRGLYRKSAPIIFEIGKLLAEAKKTLDHGDFIPWVEQSLPFDIRTAQQYMKIYRFFSKYESVSYLEKLTVSDLFITAGVRKLLPTPEKPGELKVAGGEPQEDAPDLFYKGKPLADDPPQYHAVDFIGSRLYMQRRGAGCPKHIGDLYLAVPPGLPEENFLELQKNIRIAMEIFYRHIEEAEDAGLVQPPRGAVSFKQQIRRGRKTRQRDVIDVTPREGGAGKPAAAGKEE
jgi:hypothetical protein